MTKQRNLVDGEDDIHRSLFMPTQYVSYRNIVSAHVPSTYVPRFASLTSCHLFGADKRYSFVIMK
ncbi:hypothetical protein NV377_19420 [Paenibacillus sp. T3-5-0-4]|nr:hypothetical protein [Paenibacillus endoradicis]